MKMKKIKSFLLAAVLVFGALVLFGCGNEKEVITTSQLRVGILSDVHIGFHSAYDQSDRLEKALMFYREKGVDAVIIAGDLQEHTGSNEAYTWIEEFVDVWFRVFPENKNILTGEHVEPMFIYGNHDTTLIKDEYWPEELGEYQDSWIKEVKGYQFVGAHYTRESAAQTLVDRADVLTEDKPFFYIQHLPVKGTLYNANEGLMNAGNHIYDTIRGYENLVVFTGHTHIPITNERNIWQSSKKKLPRFTTVSCGTLNYGWLKDCDDLDINGDADATQQGLYMVVDGSAVTISRYSFADMQLDYDKENTYIDITQAKVIGADWVFDACDKKDNTYDYDDRAMKTNPPEFAEGAAIDVGASGTTYVNLFIPPATVEAPEGFSDLVVAYYVEALDENEEVVSTAKVATSYHVDNDPDNFDGETFLGLEGLEPGKTYTVKVYAEECYGVRSEPLIAQVTTLG